MEIREVDASALSEPLMEIADPPQRLWVCGTPAPPGVKYLAVVGSRALTPYGREACTNLISGLAGYPISIISGLALGADSCAHRAALSYGLHTIAVPGSGLSDAVIYPRNNVELAHQILEAGGLLVSEHPPEYFARGYDFPSRNRIMVGMADAVLMIEAGKNSGTLITARLTTEYNRDLLYVPHRIGEAHGYGAEVFGRLGAAPIYKSEYILEALGFKDEESGARTLPLLEGSEKSVYALLETPQERDALVRTTGMKASDVITTLITLELKGLAKEEYGLWKRVC